MASPLQCTWKGICKMAAILLPAEEKVIIVVGVGSYRSVNGMPSRTSSNFGVKREVLARKIAEGYFSFRTGFLGWILIGVRRMFSELLSTDDEYWPPRRSAGIWAFSGFWRSLLCQILSKILLLSRKIPVTHFPKLTALTASVCNGSIGLMVYQPSGKPNWCDGSMLAFSRYLFCLSAGHLWKRNFL